MKVKKKILVLVIISSLICITSVGSLYIIQKQQEDDARITDASGYSGYSSSFTQPSGETHIVWHDDRDGYYEIYYNRVEQDRFFLYDEDLRITNHSGDSMYPSLAMDSYGYLHVAWQDNRSGNWEIYYKKLDNIGDELIDDERVTDDPANSIRPTVTVDNSNDVHITWYDDRTGNYEVYWDKRVEPELMPMDLTCDPEMPMEEDSVTIYVTIYNIGNNSASDITVECLVDDTTLDTQIISLGDNSDQTLTFNWNAEFGKHKIQIEVDPDNTIAETHESNNVITAYTTVYRVIEFTNSSIWASATVTHSVEIDVDIDEVPDPNASGTHNDIGLFVNYTATNYFYHAQLKIGYDEGELGGIPESSLKMYYWDIYDYQGERWALVEDSGVNVDEDYVWANVSHLTIFAPLSENNTSPYTPSDPDPGDGETNVEINADLSWSGGDPDPGDTVTYDVYFGTNPDPSDLVGSVEDVPATQTTITYDLETLEFGTTYYWKIAASDDHDHTTIGPIWHFTTMSLPENYMMVQSLTCVPGETDKTIYVNGGWNTAIRGYTFNVFFDPELILFDHVSWQGTVGAEADFHDSLLQEPGALTAWAIWFVGSYPIGNGSLLKLVVDISEDATPGEETTLYFGFYPPTTECVYVDTEGGNIYPALINGTLSITDVVCGDVTNNGVIDVGDVVYLINYLYRGGPPPIPMTCVGDVTCNGVVDLGDVVFLINYLYRSGPVPCPDCCNPPW